MLLIKPNKKAKMEFFELLKKRRAAHNFIPNKVIPKKDLEKMIEHTSLTPSGYNSQPWEFIIITEKENINKMHELGFEQNHIKNAAAIIMVLGDTKIGRNVDTILKDWLKYGYCTEEEIPAYRNSIAKNRKQKTLEKMALRNSMLAAMTLIYSAENMGYATCPIMGFSQHQVEDFLKIPDDRIISLMIAIGFPDTENEKPRLPRKSADEMIHWEKFKE